MDYNLYNSRANAFEFEMHHHFQSLLYSGLDTEIESLGLVDVLYFVADGTVALCRFISDLK